MYKNVHKQTLSNMQSLHFSLLLFYRNMKNKKHQKMMMTKILKLIKYFVVTDDRKRAVHSVVCTA